METFNEFLICDRLTAPASLNLTERRIFSRGINPKHWENSKPDPSDYQNGSYDTKYKREQKNYNDDRSRVKSLFNKLGLNKHQDLVSDLLSEKCNQLIQLNNKEGGKLTNFTFIARGESNPLSIVSIPSYKDSSDTSPEYGYEYECVSKVIDVYYGGIYTDHRIIGPFTRKLLRDECKEKFGLDLNEEEFIDFAKELEPDVSYCPF